MKNIFRYILVFIILLVIYFISLALVSKIPSEKMKDNVKLSANYFLENGGEKNFIKLKHKEVCLFNFTNALMINTAYSIDSNEPVKSFLTAKKNYISGVTQKIYTQTPKDLKSASKYYENGIFNGNAYQTIELYDTVNENELYESFEYSRYWHGYLVLLRPMLLFLDYSKIELLSFIIFMILLMICSFLIYTKIGKLPALALIISCIFSDLLIVTKSINEILCFDLALVFSIYLLLKKDRSNIPLNFFVFGSITNFFDFLTNPIVTYGIPIIIYFMIIYKDEYNTFKDIFFIYLKTSISWFLGYLITWVSKWILTDIIVNRETVKNAIEQINFRTTGEEIKISTFLNRLQEYFSIFSIKIIIIICLLFLLIGILNQKRLKQTNNKFIKMITYLIGTIIPFVWYFVLIQHSNAHIFFTYRNLVVTIFALQILVLEIVNLTYNKVDYEIEKGK